MPKHENKIDKVICRCANKTCELSYAIVIGIDTITFIPTINNEALTKYDDPKEKVPKLYTKQQAINLAYQTVKLCPNFNKTR